MARLERHIRWQQAQCLLVLLMVSAGPVVGLAHAAPDCGRLVSTSLPHMSVISASRIAAGQAPALPGVDPGALPAFCRVVARSHPVPGSDIGLEVWLPEQGWTGRLTAVGNGGLGGVFAYKDMAAMLAQGSVSVSTDTGHALSLEANGAVSVTWAQNQEALIDFGYRAVHEAAEGAKAITQALYGQPPSHSYFAGCSTGGRQAASEAERYPDDFDGILMGAPAVDWSTQHEAQIVEAQQTLLDPAHFIPKEKLAMIKSAVTRQCDAQDGTSDGLIADPRMCSFNPALLQCKTGDESTCLTAGQVSALRALYRGPVDHAGNQIFYGAMPGSEVEIWANIGKMEDNDLNVVDFQLVNRDPGFNWRTMDFAEQARKSRSVVGAIIDATDNDLRAFLLHGKLIAYQGWNDPYMKPERTIAFYEGTKALLGSQMMESTFRLFMVPNMGHCGGGDGPNEFGGASQTSRSGKDALHNALLALQAWVETGRAPDKIIAIRDETAGEADRTGMSRPLCPYPAIAKWNGQGDTPDEKNFPCGTYFNGLPKQ